MRPLASRRRGEAAGWLESQPTSSSRIEPMVMLGISRSPTPGYMLSISSSSLIAQLNMCKALTHEESRIGLQFLPKCRPSIARHQRPRPPKPMNSLLGSPLPLQHLSRQVLHRGQPRQLLFLARRCNRRSVTTRPQRGSVHQFSIAQLMPDTKPHCSIFWSNLVT